MGLADDIGDKLAIDVLRTVEKLGDDELVSKVAEILGASSTPTQEAFLSAVRVRQADARARAFLRARISQALGEKE
ncbi:MAG: hypothetical protein NXH82_07275 [Rhodobacteraceae bacterium]|nr:hypothetical protein [Paracoccaceae bacterium]